MRIRAGRETKRKLPLTVVTGGPDDLRVMQEEIFGPVLPLVAVESLDAAIARRRRVSERPRPRPRPLALYLFSDSSAQQERVLQATLVGGVSVTKR